MTPTEVQTRLDRLIAVLREEREAVAGLDVGAIERLTAEKASLVQTLAAAVTDLGDTRADLRETVARLAIEAEANALLVRDALAFVRGMLGAPTPGGTYDAHGAPAGRGAHRITRSV